LFSLSGHSAARLARLLWEQEVAGSNPAAPTSNNLYFLYYQYVTEITPNHNGRNVDTSCSDGYLIVFGDGLISSSVSHFFTLIKYFFYVN
jgi:hypothetical protein